MDKNTTQLEFKTIENEKYKVKSIRDNTIYAKASEADHLLGLYYLVS